MNKARLQELAARFGELSIAVVGDFCLDRYLEIDPGRSETSTETGLEVHNVVNVRSQPGGAGTILSNLAELGVGSLHAVGFCGNDGEGAELLQSLKSVGDRVQLNGFIQTSLRRTFTYTKPLLLREGKPPRELNRLDFKNWEATPASLSQQLCETAHNLFPRVDAMVVLDQVDAPNTGVITQELLNCLGELSARCDSPLILGDSRNAIDQFPSITLKVNNHEFLRKLSPETTGDGFSLEDLVQRTAVRRSSRLFVTLGEEGILCGAPGEAPVHVSAYPLRGDIDIVGAGDSVTANLAAALASGASNREAMELAMAAASVAIHKVGTTGTANPVEISKLLPA